MKARGGGPGGGGGGGRGGWARELPPFYSGANLHNDQRQSCLSKLFPVICIIFARGAEGERKKSAFYAEACFCLQFPGRWRGDVWWRRVRRGDSVIRVLINPTYGAAIAIALQFVTGDKYMLYFRGGLKTPILSDLGGGVKERRLIAAAANCEAQ